MSASLDGGSAAETGLTKFPSYSEAEVIGQLHNIIGNFDMLRAVSHSRLTA
jgi:hypothetical protein